MLDPSGLVKSSKAVAIHRDTSSQYFFFYEYTGINLVLSSSLSLDIPNHLSLLELA